MSINLKRSPQTGDGRPRIAVEKPDTTKVTLYSHDWCSKTTWCEAAIRIVDEVATDSGDHLTYNLANNGVIDTYHGLITQEDFLKDPQDNSYRVTVKVNDAVKTEQDPAVGSGGDYTINYGAGSITFLSALDPGDVVKVTYHYATSSVFTIKATAGKHLLIDYVEVQFAADVDLTTSVTFQPYGYVQVFAPQYWDGYDPPGPYPLNTLIPLGDPLVYKGMRDYLNDAVRAYVKYPQGLGGTSWRGLSQDVYIFDWDYVRATRLLSEYGMEVRVCLMNDVKFGGSYATATFYCTVEDS